MSQLFKSFTKVLISIFIFSALFLVACSADQFEEFDRRISGAGEPTSQTTQAAEGFILAGKVTDPVTEKWLNDYLVIVFLNGEEIGRHISTLDKFENSGEGKHDGLFKVAFPNTYELDSETFFLRSDGNYMAIATETGSLGNPLYLYSWLDEMAPGTLIRMQVPDKQIEYAIKIMEIPVTTMPEKYLARGQATLTNTDQVEAPEIPGPEISGTENVGTGGAVNSVAIEQIATIKEEEMSQEVRWTRTLSGYSGNRYEVWERFIQPTVPGLSWNEFKEQVLIYNPQLVTDGNLFHPNKLYIIPELN